MKYSKLYEIFAKEKDGTINSIRIHIIFETVAFLSRVKRSGYMNLIDLRAIAKRVAEQTPNGKRIRFRLSKIEEKRYERMM